MKKPPYIIVDIKAKHVRIEAQAYTVLRPSGIKRENTMWASAAATAAAPEQQRAGKHARTEGGSSKKENKLLEQLDYRIRKLESETPTWFLPETEGVLIPALKTAHATYKPKAVKGQPHPDGPCRR